MTVPFRKDGRGCGKGRAIKKKTTLFPENVQISDGH